jgi:hypothetical protein
VSIRPSPAAGHEEGLLGQVVELAGDDALERLDRVGQLDELAGAARELLGHEEGLRHEALQAPRAADDLLVVLAELVHAQDGDDVLQLLVALQDALHRRGRVVPLADELRVEDARRESSGSTAG